MLCNKFYTHNFFATNFKHNFFYLENITTFCRCSRGFFCVCGIFDTWQMDGWTDRLTTDKNVVVFRRTTKSPHLWNIINWTKTENIQHNIKPVYKQPFPSILTFACAIRPWKHYHSSCAHFDKTNWTFSLDRYQKFTSIFVYFDLDVWPWTSVGFILTSWVPYKSSLTNRHSMVYSLSYICIHSQVGHTDKRTDGTIAGQYHYFM